MFLPLTIPPSLFFFVKQIALQCRAKKLILNRVSWQFLPLNQKNRDDVRVDGELLEEVSELIRTHH